jgi:glycosyltransferase involved in cell wall biosynthesis
MRIGVEATAITRSKRTGVDHYTFQLLSSMAKLKPEYKFVLCYFAFATKRSLQFGLELSNVSERRNSWFPTRIYNGLYRYLLAPPIDLLTGCVSDFFLFPNFVRWPLAFSGRSGVIVYDLSYIHSASTLPNRLRSFLERKVPSSIVRSDVVIAVSHNTKREIIATYNTLPDKIIVAHPGVDRSVFYPRKRVDCSDVLESYGLAWKQFILFTGTIEPRKNIAGLLEGYALMAKELRERYPLVLAGGKGWLDENIHSRVNELVSEGCTIVNTGYLPQEHMPIMLSSAQLFVFPSLYEGFGMPPLEAMACGTPVVTSNNSSLPEVVGDAGLMVDAYDYRALSEAMIRVISDHKLANKLKADGLKQAAKFQWEDSAHAVLDAIARTVCH